MCVVLLFLDLSSLKDQQITWFESIGSFYSFNPNNEVGRIRLTRRLVSRQTTDPPLGGVIRRRQNLTDNVAGQHIETD